MYFCRHAESFGNIGNLRVDSPLSDYGVEQAKLLSGFYDCIVISPMRRCLETLHYSNITYNKLYICEDFRERIFGHIDNKLLEKMVPETDKEFFERTKKFEQQLETIKKEHNTILLIGHSYYYNCWWKKGCYPSPPNAQIIKM
jgi:broad specificity phosphatase PhoE